MLRTNVKPAQLHPSRSGIRRELSLNLAFSGSATVGKYSKVDHNCM